MRHRLFLSALLIALLHTSIVDARSQSVLPIPTEIKDGDTVLLQCGRLYSGELNLERRTRVTIKTDGDCGRATITPARLIKGWERDPKQPDLWSAAVDFKPVQLESNGRFMELAHYPNRPKIWERGRSTLPDQLRVRLPHQDLASATLVWRAADWLIQTRAIQRYSDGTIYLAEGQDDGFPLLPETDFYVEGKRWMLDAPGEWSWADGRLTIWPWDDKSPEGRVWAAPYSRGINASGSQHVRLTQIHIRGAMLGIDGSDAHDLRIADVDISNSGEDALLAGGHGLRVERVNIDGTVQNGIRANDDARDVTIMDSQIRHAGMLGMPRRSKGAIVFEQASGQRILRNQIRNSAYIGIRIFRDALVADNVIDRACLVLTDCGGIYTFARDRQPLHVRIERNRISNLTQRMAHAIYLDDYANGVIVSDNHITNNPGGMQLHNSFGNIIRRNVFSGSNHEHILFNETGQTGVIHANLIVANRFVSRPGVPTYRLWSEHGGKYVQRFGQFVDNRYGIIQKDFAEVAGIGMVSFQDWQTQMQDAKSGKFSLKGVLGD